MTLLHNKSIKPINNTAKSSILIVILYHLKSQTSNDVDKFPKLYEIFENKYLSSLFEDPCCQFLLQSQFVSLDGVFDPSQCNVNKLRRDLQSEGFDQLTRDHNRGNVGQGSANSQRSLNLGPWSKNFLDTKILIIFQIRYENHMCDFKNISNVMNINIFS